VVREVSALKMSAQDEHVCDFRRAIDIMQSKADEGQAQSPSYWPEIDGLRSIAVLSVLAFHFDRRILSGGFVGVDVFFVISGFLITSILLLDFDSGHFSIARFYQRRIARIAPAFFVVLLTSLGVSALIYSKQDFASLGVNSAAAALSAINLKLLFQGSYFQLSPDAQPILHYWSLSVEEQFYLVFPIYLFLVLRFTKRPLTITIIGCLLSFAACVILTWLKPINAFYLLPTRAWELLAGSGLALFQRDNNAAALRPASIATWTGLIFLASSFLFINEGASFPGWIAAAPVVGTLLILSSIKTAEGSHTIRPLLASSLLVFIGKRSFSLYLWHWPVFSFVDYHFFLSNSLFRTTLKLGICIGATLLTYSIVERPMRAFLNRRQHALLTFATFALAVTMVCIAGIEIRSRSYLEADSKQIQVGGVFVKGGGQGTVALVGDSQAVMYGYEIASLARDLCFDLNVLAGAATNQLPNEPDTHWDQVKQFLEDNRPDVVVLSELWSLKAARDSRNLSKAIYSLKPFIKRIILITQPPILPREATREAIRSGVRPPFFEEKNDFEGRMLGNVAVKSLADDQVIILDVANSFLEVGEEIRVVGTKGRFNYQDATHLSDTGTASLRSMLEKALSEALPPHPQYCAPSTRASAVPPALVWMLDFATSRGQRKHR
jgi:peptidoglycan/LPS O-acetylase OafA/YrhL